MFSLQVQFRLKQIVDADPESKEQLLRELEEFAFRGIPDFQKSMRCVEGAQYVEEQDHSSKMEAHQAKQKELIQQLKQQLEDLERYAYETGEAGMPQTLIVERQKVIIGELLSFIHSVLLFNPFGWTDQMKNKLPLNIDELDKLSLDELRQQVDAAIGQLVNPLKMKEQLVCQLKTQITDLERFIEFLQGPGGENPGAANGPCICSVHNMTKPAYSASAGRPTSAKSQQITDKVRQ
jgi:RUN domain-containing protein 1